MHAEFLDFHCMHDKMLTSKAWKNVSKLGPSYQTDLVAASFNHPDFELFSLTMEKPQHL